MHYVLIVLFLFLCFLLGLRSLTAGLTHRTTSFIAVYHPYNSEGEPRYFRDAHEFAGPVLCTDAVHKLLGAMAVGGDVRVTLAGTMAPLLKHPDAILNSVTVYPPSRPTAFKVIHKDARLSASGAEGITLYPALYNCVQRYFNRYGQCVILLSKADQNQECNHCGAFNAHTDNTPWRAVPACD